MSNPGFTPVKVSELSFEQKTFLEKNMVMSLSVAWKNLSSEKTHAIAKIVFNESYTTAQLCFTRNEVHYGWPNLLTNLSTLNSASLTTDISKCIISWPETTLQGVKDPFLVKNTDLIKEFGNKYLNSVEKVTLTFDSEKTYEHSLLKVTIVEACKRNFPNLKAYSLVFNSL